MACPAVIPSGSSRRLPFRTEGPLPASRRLRADPFALVLREGGLHNLRAMRGALGPGAAVMADADQAFDRDTALRVADAVAPRGLARMEEPPRVDAPACWSSTVSPMRVGT